MRTRKFNPAATGQGGLLGGFQDDIVSGLLGMGNQASSSWEEWMQDPVRNIRESLTDWPAIDTDAMAARGITEDDFLNALDSVAPGAGMLGDVIGGMAGATRTFDSGLLAGARDTANTLPGQISTRYPTAKNAVEDPMSHDLIVGMESSLLDEGNFIKNSELISSYPGASGSMSPHQRVEDMIEFERDNLNFLHDQVPSPIRNETKEWYKGANVLAEEAAQKHGYTTEQIAGVYAPLSPQKDWYMNVSLGDRVIDAMANKQSVPWTREMDSKFMELAPRVKAKAAQVALGQIRGKSLGELKTPEEMALWIRINDEAMSDRSYRAITPQGTRGETVMIENNNGIYAPSADWGGTGTIANAVRSLLDPSLENISRNMGQQHKVRSFYNNIIAPDSLRGDITMDTHAIAAGLLSPYGGSAAPVLHNFGSGVKGQGGPANSSVVGNKGTYGMHAEAYKRAAADQGVLPREMQSITWEAIRGLFDNKSPRIKAKVAEIWGDYERGLTTQGHAQRKIMNLAGGINPPTWLD